MRLIKGDIPNLVGGVSQQNKRQRFANQHDEVLNCENDIIRGIRKRHGTRFVSDFPISGSGIEANMHIIKKSDTEKYIAFVGVNGDVVVRDFFTGIEYPVVNNAKNYLSNDSATKDAISFLTIGDDTILLNKGKTTRLSNELSHSTTGEEIESKTTTYKLDLTSVVSEGRNTMIGTMNNMHRYDFIKGYLDKYSGELGYVTWDFSYDGDESWKPSLPSSLVTISDKDPWSLSFDQPEKLVNISKYNFTKIILNVAFDYKGVEYTTSFDYELPNYTKPTYTTVAKFKNDMQNGITKIAEWINSVSNDSLGGEVVAVAREDKVLITHPNENEFVLKDTGQSQFNMTMLLEGNIWKSAQPNNGHRCHITKADTRCSKSFYTSKFLAFESSNNDVQQNPRDLFSQGRAALVWINQLDYNVNYKVRVGVNEAIITTPAANSSEGQMGLSSEKYTKSLSEQIETTIPELSADIIDGVILVSRKDGQDFEIFIDDGLYGNGLKVVKYVISDESELPFSAPKDFIVKVQPTKSSLAYYLKYSSEGRDGVWEETVAPLVKYKFRNDTLPHAMTHKTDKQYSSETNINGIFFEVGEVDWEAKEAGDDNSSPFPSFIDQKINTMTFSRNRLWFFGGDWVCSTAAGEIKRWMPITVASILDDAPIDVRVDIRDKQEIIKHCLPVEDGILLFSDRILLVTSFDQPMTSATVSVKDLGSYKVSDYAKPNVGENNIYFVSDSSNHNRLYLANLIQGQKRDFTDVSDHCPEYIKGTATKIIPVTSKNKVLIVMDTGEIYVYDYMNTADGSRIQSAWSKWEFEGSVVDIDVETDSVYLIIRYGSKMVIESMSIGYDSDVSYSGRPVFLDRLVVHDVEPEGLELEPNEVIEQRNGVWLQGFPYKQRLVMSEFFRASDGSNPFEGGVTKIRNVELKLNKSSWFDATVKDEIRPDRKYEFRGRVMGERKNVLGMIPESSATYTIPIMLDKSRLTLVIENDSSLECNIVSLSWNGKHHGIYQKV